MKSLIALSLAANLALGGVLLWRTLARPAVTAVVLPTVSAPAATAPASPIAPGPQTWRQLNGETDAEFVARLRAEGFPPKMMYALVTLRLRERHADALRKFQAPADFAYWREDPSNNDPPFEQRAARRALDRQIADERRQLLGPDADSMTVYQRANSARLYGDVSPEKVDQIVAINQDYGDISAMVKDRGKGLLLQEDRDQLAAIEQERRADLAKLLTPQELFEYDLRSSPSATSVRYGLRAFEATEEEFRTLVSLQLAFDKTYGGSGSNLSGEQQQQRALATAELETQVKAMMPPDRYAEYEVKTNSSYPWISNLIAQFGSPGQADAVVASQIDLARRFNVLRSDRTLSAEARNAQLDTLSVEANTRMATALGPEAFKRYKGNGGPINALLNRPAGTPSSPRP